MRRTIIACAAIVLLASALAGCREEEQGRPLVIDKGTYKGQADSTLSKAQMDDLTGRAALQGDVGPSSVATGATPAAERPFRDVIQEKAQESSMPLSEGALNERLLLQSGK